MFRSLLLLRFHLQFGSSWNAPTLQLLDLKFSSDHSWLTGMLIIFQTVSPLSQTFVPIKHSTMAHGFYAIHLLDYLKHFASGFA
jgi:hypothetical protein